MKTVESLGGRNTYLSNYANFPPTVRDEALRSRARGVSESQRKPETARVGRHLATWSVHVYISLAKR